MSSRAKLLLTTAGAILVAALLGRALVGQGDDFAAALHTAPIATLGVAALVATASAATAAVVIVPPGCAGFSGTR